MSSSPVRQIHLIFLGFGTAACLNNIFITFYRREGLAGLIDSRILVPLAVVLAFALLLIPLKRGSARFARKIEILHVILVLLVALVATLDEYSSIYGVGFFLAGGLVALQYRLVRQNNRVAITLYFLAIAVVAQFSAWRKDRVVISLAMLSYLIFMYALLLTMARFQVRRILAENRMLKGERDEFKSLFDSAAGTDHYLDLTRVLSRRQLEIARQLYVSQKTDKENASEMGISVNTYRNHLKEIRRILDVGTKVELISRVRPYFLLQEPQNSGPAVPAGAPLSGE